jgi:hypothetical protein
MLEFLLILLMLVPAAVLVVGGRLHGSLRGFFGLSLGQASKAASHSFAALLRSAPGCQGVALAAALARPAPVVARQVCLQRVRLGSPPGRPHGRAARA